jgi:glycosyltransferase involved in cell wall biosynthesis
MARRKFDSVVSWKEGESALFHSFIFHRKNQKNITWIHTNLSLNHWTMFWVYNNKTALEQKIYRNKHLSNLIFVSQSQKSCFQTLYPDACPTQSVIYNLIDKDHIIQKSQQFEVPKRQFTICCIGRLSIEKRIDKAMQAAKELKERGYSFELWIVGGGFCYEELTAMIDRLDLTDCVKMLGYQPNPFPYLKAADVLLLTSDTESFSLVLCEALCLSKPVVSTPTFGPVELLERKYGIISAFDVSSIANCLAELMIDKDLYANLSELSLQRASQLFDVEKTMQQIYELL